MTARIATHPQVAMRGPDVLDRLVAAGVDVELASSGGDPVRGVLEGSFDLALVGARALRGTAADGLTMLAVLPREDPRDVLVAVEGAQAPLAELPAGSRVGVAGARRLAFLMAHRPDLQAVAMEEGNGAEPIGGAMKLDALVMGSGEARRRGLGGRTTEVLDPGAWLPEPGQGVVALMARHPIAEVTALDHLPTRTALRAELALLDAMDAPHDAPLGALAQASGRLLRLWAAVASTDGRRLVRSERTGPLDEPELLGASVARELEARGAAIVLALVAG